MRKFVFGVRQLIYFLVSKEVIHPQVPLRIPCYDLAPLAKPKFECSKNCTLT